VLAAFPREAVQALVGTRCWGAEVAGEEDALAALQVAHLVSLALQERGGRQPQIRSSP
jgi:hypothetical protein